MNHETFTHDDIRQILVERIGFSEAELPDDLDTTFTELGMDSLAIVELQLTLQQDYGVRIPDEDAHLMTTPRETIDYVNRRRLVSEAA
ncbi:MAG: minimal acyl carrier protein [Solirubrobacteraceae bacterium]|nr:minimal acyl carrier protein [Solirubrobacteraceae bacterium]MEA2137180.1 minimal acyl carrier protein [Solirubrobacteraceae bacterium]